MSVATAPKPAPHLAVWLASWGNTSTATPSFADYVRKNDLAGSKLARLKLNRNRFDELAAQRALPESWHEDEVIFW